MILPPRNLPPPEEYMNSFAETCTARDNYAKLTREGFLLGDRGLRVDDDVEMILFILGFYSEYYPPNADGVPYTITQALFDLDSLKEACQKVQAKLENIQVQYGDLILISPATEYVERQRRLSKSEDTINKIGEALEKSAADIRARMGMVQELNKSNVNTEVLPPKKKIVGTVVGRKLENSA